jgi:hypothetical protein
MIIEITKFFSTEHGKGCSNEVTDLEEYITRMHIEICFKKLVLKSN